MTRIFDPEGVELSGGEGQKLAILRAIHKNAPILILDEPTAALDPATENEIYEKYFDIAKRCSDFKSAISALCDENGILRDN